MRALAEDRLTDGGTPEAVAAAREAALPPVPVLGADGRTTVTFELLLHCYRQDPGHERAIILSLRTWAADRTAVIDAFETTCAIVRAE